MDIPTTNLAVVPIMVEGVVVVKITLDDTNQLRAEITSGSSESYFKELLLTHAVRGVSIDLAYVDAEPPVNQVDIPSYGHLHLVRSAT